MSFSWEKLHCRWCIFGSVANQEQNRGRTDLSDLNTITFMFYQPWLKSARKILSKKHTEHEILRLQGHKKWFHIKALLA